MMCCGFFYTNLPSLIVILLVCNRDTLEYVTNFKFLGVIIDETLSWKKHIEFICNKLLTVIYILRYIKPLVSINTLRTIYTSLFQPHLLYGIISWYKPNSKSTIDCIYYKKAIRLISKSKYNTHTSPLFKNLKILKLVDLYTKQCLILYWKFVNKKMSPNLTINLSPNNTVHLHHTRHACSIHLK